MLPVPTDNLNSQHFSSKCNSDFSEIVSRKYRLLIQQFLKRTTLEKKLILFIIIVIAAILLVAICVLYLGLKSNQQMVCTKPGCIYAAARLLKGMNTSVDPCENFYDYVCGEWSKSRENPSDEMDSWFIQRTKYMTYEIKKILEEEQRNSDLKPILQMKKFYKLCTDTDNLNKKGLEPIHKILDLLGLSRTFPNSVTPEYFNLAKTLSYIQRLLNLDILIQLSTHFNETLNTTLLSIGPAPYEVSSLTSKSNRKKRNILSPEKFLIHKMNYMTSVIMEFKGSLTVPDITREALKILLLDAQLKLNADEENSFEQYVTLRDLQNYMFPNVTSNNSFMFNWEDYICVLVDGLNITLKMDNVVHVVNPLYFQSLGNHLINLKLVTFQRYVWWKIIDTLAPHTTDSMRSYKYIFEEYVYDGIAKSTRSSTCISLTKTVFNKAIGHVIATRQNFSETFAKVTNIMSDIKSTFKKMISDSKWIDDETKKINLWKVDAIKVFIGYPNELVNPTWILEYYQKIKIVEDDFIASLLMIRSTQANDILNLLYTPFNYQIKNISWSIDSTEVNAYYSRDTNSIVIPQGILQYPFYIDGIEVLNYGAIGSILGHELTHGFDSEGKNYDWNGDKRTTWNENMISVFNNHSLCFINQYQKYRIEENVMVNGNITLAENIADNGGIKEAFLAYKEYVSRNGTEHLLPAFEKFTHEQLLFISFANTWCKKENEVSKKFNEADEHSPNNFRVIGSLSNLPEFADTWNCQNNSRMNPSKKCSLW